MNAFLQRPFVFLQVVTAAFWYSQPLSSETGASSASLSGHVGNSTIFFLNSKRVAHHRYHLDLNQKSKVSEQLATTVAARFYYDAALADHPAAARRDIEPEVRADEISAAELREGSVDLSLPLGKLRIGKQIIDWIDSITPYASDILTPIDFRQGGFGAANQIIRPVDAALWSLPFPGGALETLVVVNPLGHLLPKGPNGYGNHEALQARFPQQKLTLEDDGIPKNGTHVEAGARYVGYVGGIDLSLLAFHGHERTPILHVVSADRAQVNLKTDYAMLNTYGGSFSVALDAVVLRALTFYEPARRLQSFALGPNKPGAPIDLYAQRYRHGLGIDLVINEHFKFYSETWANQLKPSDDALALDPSFEHFRTDYTVSSRVTNESFSKILLTIESVISTPRHSSIFSPSVSWTIGEHTKLGMGWRMISSDNPAAPYDSLKDADHAYGNLDWYF